MSWTIDDLAKLDRKYAEEGVPMDQRPFRAARDILGASFNIGVGGSPDVEKIMIAYAEMIPDVDATWPGLGRGIIASVDQVRKVVVPIIYGNSGQEIWRSLGFISQDEWWTWCRRDRSIASSSYFAFADLHDFAYGFDDMRGEQREALGLWYMAASNLSDVASALPSVSGVDTIIQPICLIAELALKAVLVFKGANPNEFRGPKGHDCSALASRVVSEIPHRDDSILRAVIARLPPYVTTRYEPAGKTRLEVVRLALAVQFVAASTVRRVSERDLAIEVETNKWPGPRLPPFL